MLGTALNAGVSPETLRNIESGRVAIPAFPTIAAIADVPGLPSTQCGRSQPVRRPGRTRKIRSHRR
ncbi:helix-turn-helix transcriptional regulator [Micromonospora sp. NPDC007271]|uniref:helix-turn-helix domain-containing protein n=1 Tax=Micromonospora sp. NPDC007271 TaxID=3154587 RepID=UPI0033F911A4